MAARSVNHVAIAERIVKFFQVNKGVGNTAAILDGARATRANIILVHEGEKGFKQVKTAKQISFEEIMAGQLDDQMVKGFPLVIDNGAVVELLSGLLADIDRLDKAARAAKSSKKEPKSE